MFNFEDGELIENGYVEINGVKYPIVMPKYTGNVPLTAENLNVMQVELLKTVFPIGATYITQEDINPSLTLKFGTWERVKGKVLVGIDEDDSDFASFGQEGGEKTHTLTINEMPSHNHSVSRSGAVLEGGYTALYNNNGAKELGFSTENTGGGQPFNITQPYKVVGYMWIRTQ